MTSNKNSGGFGAWFVRMLSRLLLLLIFFVAGALTMHIGMHADDHDNMVQMQATINSQDKQIIDLQAKLEQNENQLIQAQSTESELSSKITDLQTNLTKTEQELAFYEQLIPAGPAGSVSIRAFTIEMDGEHINYKVLLTRNSNGDTKAFNGELKFIAEGMQNGKKSQQELESTALTIDRVLRNTGVLALEPEFKLKEVRLEIVHDGDVIATSTASLAK